MSNEQSIHRGDVIAVENVSFKTQTVQTSSVIHLTGGLQARRDGEAWSVGPFEGESGLETIRGLKDEALGRFAAHCGLQLLGVEDVTVIEPLLPDRHWQTFLGLPDLTLTADQSWGAVASTAHRAGDKTYASLARSISASLRASGLQMRNASAQYNVQLVAALERQQKPDLWFSNGALADLHLSLHSWLAEMASVRDYLARVAAIRIGAPDKIDALNRLIAWLSKDVNSHGLNDSLVSQLVVTGTKLAAVDWLYELGEYRNTFLHTQSIGADERSDRLTLQLNESPFGSVKSIILEIGVLDSEHNDLQDALPYFADLHRRLCRLAATFAVSAKYPAAPPTISFRLQL